MYTEMTIEQLEMSLRSAENDVEVLRARLSEARINPGRTPGTVDSSYIVGHRAAWKEMLRLSAQVLGVGDTAAQAALLAQELRDIEVEVRELWFTYASSDYDEDGSLLYPCERPPFPEGIPLSDVLRQFGDYL